MIIFPVALRVHSFVVAVAVAVVVDDFTLSKWCMTKNISKKNSMSMKTTIKALQ